VIGTGAALVATIWIAASLTIFPELIHSDSPPSELRTESMQLTCLSPQQAADLINPYVRSHGSNWYIPKSGISVITIRGTGDELAKSRDLIAQFETDPGAACKIKGGEGNPIADPAVSVDVDPAMRAVIAGEPAPALPAKVTDKVPTAPKRK
jgi:hypothetical protein